MQAPNCAQGDICWPVLFDALREKLQLTPFYLKVGLHHMQQDKTPPREFARKFEEWVMDTVTSEEGTKASLIAALNNDTLACQDNHVSMLGEVDTTRLETTE